jgi:predicted RNA-binding Zn-ribbon protein involved in translation (DUF1610 family)
MSPRIGRGDLESAMATIECSCPRCGRVALRPPDLELVLLCDGSGFYAFDCPRCGDRVRKPADEHAVCLLVFGGVVATEAPPGPVLGPGRATGSPLTVDDLIDFHQLLTTGDWFDRLAQRVPPTG